MIMKKKSLVFAYHLSAASASISCPLNTNHPGLSGTIHIAKHITAGANDINPASCLQLRKAPAANATKTPTWPEILSKALKAPLTDGIAISVTYT